MDEYLCKEREEPDNKPHMKITDDLFMWKSGLNIFHDLMQKRIVNILLVSSSYDLFILEGEGQLAQLLTEEYLDLNLRFLPHIERASSGEQALVKLKTMSFDLIILMLGTGALDHIHFGQEAKKINPAIPIVLLAYEAHELAYFVKQQVKHSIDNVFLWQGDVKLFLAIIKLLEDQYNVEHDVQKRGVQVILVIEDHFRYYSSYLPLLYSQIMQQTQRVIEASVHTKGKLLRMRARPKILLAKTYEEAKSLYSLYTNNILGIITDASFPRSGVEDETAGIEFIKEVQAEHCDIPILLQSSEQGFRSAAEQLRVSFLDKNSQAILDEFQAFILNQLGFGDFVFRFPDGREIARVNDLKSLQAQLRTAPIESILYHGTNNHFSHWLKTRTEFEIAERLRQKTVAEFCEPEAIRRHLISILSDVQVEQRRGEVIEMPRTKFDPRFTFAKIGQGSMGGKARGLAFFNSFLSHQDIKYLFKDVNLFIPTTIVLTTEVFDEFIARNDLKRFMSEVHSEDDVYQAFTSATLPASLVKDLTIISESCNFPLAVRSSSLFEDSKYLPFAGVYNTILCPNSHRELGVRIHQLSQAIKLVYASMFVPSAKAYLGSTPYLMEEERMAVVIQQLVGSAYGNRFYPVFSGVARSHNHYPVPPMKATEGIVSLALGLGRMVVDEGQVIRFSPKHPAALPQFASAADYLQFSQKQFYTVDLLNDPVYLAPFKDVSMLKLPIIEAERDEVLPWIGSTYSPESDRIYDGTFRQGVKLVTFAPILKGGAFPLCNIVTFLLDQGQRAMACDVEIEFAVNFGRPDKPARDFGFLQIRPAITGSEKTDVELGGIPDDKVICHSKMALGNGRLATITDVIYVKPETFDRARTKQIAAELGTLNDQMVKQGRRYLLIGFCRWGTSDPWLGIPVDWTQISNAAVIVESGLPDFFVEPSQGTHFFQNIVSQRIGYLTVNPGRDGFIDWEWFNRQSVSAETQHARHLFLSEPLDIIINGHLHESVILKSRT